MKILIATRASQELYQLDDSSAVIVDTETRQEYSPSSVGAALKQGYWTVVANYKPTPILDSVWDELGHIATEKHLAGKHDQQSHAGGRGKADVEVDLKAAKKAVAARMKEAKASGDYSGISTLRKKARDLEDELKGAPDSVTTAKRDAYDAIVDGKLERIPDIKKALADAKQEKDARDADSRGELVAANPPVEGYEGPLQTEQVFNEVEDMLFQDLQMDPGVERRAKALGYKDTEEMMDAILEDTVHMLSRSDVYMSVPSAILPRILSEGFKNQHETGTSKGLLDNNVRAEAEYQMFGIAHGRMPDKYPTYGFISQQGRTGAGSSYGDATIKFKHHVKQRTTITLEDSLDGGLDGTLIPSPFSKPRLASLTLGDAKRLASPKKARATSTATLNKADTYWEAQLHGKLTYKDIDSITFLNPPYEEERKLLAELGIPYTVI